MNLIQRITETFSKVTPLPAGLHHLQSTGQDEKPFRIHLRLREHGTGILIVNAATILHLNPTAAECAFHFIKGTEPAQAAKQIAARYRAKQEVILQDYKDFVVRIQTVLSTPDLDPVSYLDFERISPHSTNLTAPFRLDCALTYQLPAGDKTDHAPVKRVDSWTEVRRFTVDDKAPASKVDALPEYVNSQEFVVSWTGAHNAGGSGIESYTLMVTDNGAAPYAWLTRYNGTSAVFRGAEGHAYQFWSIAVDFADNTEVVVADNKIGTTVDSVAPTASISAIARYQAKPNFMVSWTGRDVTSGIADYTVYLSIDGADFTAWQENTTETSAQYRGQDGHLYTFFETVKKVSKFKAHDEVNQCKVGDEVKITETRPMSKDKRWLVLEILDKSARSTKK